MRGSRGMGRRLGCERAQCHPTDIALAGIVGCLTTSSRQLSSTTDLHAYRVRPHSNEQYVLISTDPAYRDYYRMDDIRHLHLDVASVSFSTAALDRARLAPGTNAAPTHRRIRYTTVGYMICITAKESGKTPKCTDHRATKVVHT